MGHGVRGILALGLLMGSAVGASAPPAALQQVGVVPIPNLVAHWPFSEGTGSTTEDVSGNNNDGTLQSGAAFSNNVPTFPGGGFSVQFAQSGSSHVAVPSSASLQQTGSLTLAAWINVTGTDFQHGIIEKWTQSGGVNGGYMLRLHADECLAFAVIPAAGIQEISTVPRVVPLGQWIHVAGVYNQNGGSMTLYVNGAPDATTASGVAAPAAESSPLRIGRDYASNGLNGLIDEPRIYSKALTAGEIGVLRTGQAEPTGLQAQPGVGTVDLSWTAPAAVAGVTVTYAIKRSTTSGGPYTVVATDVPGTTYTDTGLGLGVQYFYVVSAVSVLESIDSLQAQTTTLNPTPRTKDHEEGLQDGKCACGSTIAAPLPSLAGLILAMLPLLLRRRSS